MNSWSIYRRPEIHWATISRYRAEKAWLAAKFFIRLDEESGTFGYYIERSNEKTDSRVDWLNFLNWLADENHVTWLHKTMQSQGMSISDPYGGSEQALRRTTLTRMVKNGVSLKRSSMKRIAWRLCW